MERHPNLVPSNFCLANSLSKTLENGHSSVVDYQEEVGLWRMEHVWLLDVRKPDAQGVHEPVVASHLQVDG